MALEGSHNLADSIGILRRTKPILEPPRHALLENAAPLRIAALRPALVRPHSNELNLRNLQTQFLTQ